MFRTILHCKSISLAALAAGVLALALVQLTPPLEAAAKKDPPQRSVQGLVTDDQENPIAKAVVQLKNVKTMDVKSYFTDEKGAYHFNGLDPDTNYEIKVNYGNSTSNVRKVTPFDSRKELIINFKLETKQ